MMVLGRVLYLIMMVLFVKMEFFQQTQVLQFLQRPVNGRKADAGLFFLGPAMDFIGIQMLFSQMDNLQDY